MPRTFAFWTPLASSILCVALAACAAEPGTDVAPFDPDSEGSTSPSVPGGSGGGAEAPVGDGAAALLVERCSSTACHDADAPAAGLDLESPDLGERLTGMPSALCSGEVMVVAGDPGASYLLAKLGGMPACGVQMPVNGTPLSVAERDLVSDWIAALDSPVVGAPDAGVPTGGDPPPGSGW